MPATSGEANEVPVARIVPAAGVPGQPVSPATPGGAATGMQLPGATTSTLPNDDQGATAPDRSVAPTEITSG